eukprot:COSAG01_NODE_363_length_18113_cov_45.041690_10_plen_752_part_00
MEEKISSLQTTIHDHSARIRVLEAVAIPEGRGWRTSGNYNGGHTAASSPPPAGTSLPVARLGRVEATVQEQAREVSEVREDARALEQRVAGLEAERRGEEQGRTSTPLGQQQLQGATEARLRSVEAQCANLTSTSQRTARRLEEDDGHSYVTQHFAAVTLTTGPVGTGAVSGGTGTHGGHRRAQGGDSSCANFNSRANAVQIECCNEPTEDCSSGAPSSCNADCAAVYLPFWADCGAHLTTNLALYQSVVAQCQAAGSGGAGSGSLVQQFDLVCANNTVSNCVPRCSAMLHGDLLLMTVDGQDNKYACELHNNIYSWIGPAAEGGYIGGDVLTFVSAVVSGAAGLFMLTLTSIVASISTLLTVQPGQVVAISGTASQHTTWGSGGFSVLQRGGLTLGRVSVNGPMTVAAGGTLQLNDVVLGTLACLTAHPGSVVGLNGTQTPPVCPHCNPIAHCRTAQCTARGSICSQCDAGYYSFRHDDSAGSCYSSTMGITQVGVTANAVGAFHFGLVGGSIPADLAAAATTITVPRRASLFLVGTGAEAIAASFSVQGALSLTALSVTGASTISVATGSSLTVSASQLVDSTGEGHHTQPFPCDGTLAHGCMGAHAGVVTMPGPMIITTAAPPVCDAASRQCVGTHPVCPAHATAAPGDWYCSDLVGACRGPGGSSDYVNAKYKTRVTRSACQAECDAAAACMGYTYRASGFEHCSVHGPGLDTDLAGGWTAVTHPTTTIVGANGDSRFVCAAVAGRN